MPFPLVCSVTGCTNRPEYREKICTPCQLAGATTATVVNTEAPARRDSGTVCVLTLREAVALRDALLESSVGFFLTEWQDSGGEDLGRAFRVLSKQIAWLESNIKGSGRPRVNGSAA